MRWKVPVDNFSGDLRLLTDVLAQWHIKLRNSPEGELFLESKLFEVCQDHNKVWNIALHVSETLQALKESTKNINLGFKISSVIEKKKMEKALNTPTYKSHR